MNAYLHRQSAYRDALSWMLITALLLLLLFPLHYHLSHAAPVASDATPVHDHATDTHIFADDYAVDDHPDNQTFDPAPDASFKNNGVQLPLFALLSLSVLLPLSCGVYRHAQLTRNIRLPRISRHTTPPLRAPPRI